MGVVRSTGEADGLGRVALLRFGFALRGGPRPPELSTLCIVPCGLLCGLRFLNESGEVKPFTAKHAKETGKMRIFESSGGFLSFS